MKNELIKIIKDVYDSGKLKLDRDRAEFEAYVKIITLLKVEEAQRDIQSVLHMIEGSEERHKIANYIREYMLKKKP